MSRSSSVSALAAIIFLFSPALAIADSIVVSNLQVFPALPVKAPIAIDDQGNIAATALSPASSQMAYILPANGGPVFRFGVPGAVRTNIYGLNEQGTIVGTYYAASDSTTQRGFLYTNGNLTSLDVSKLVTGINNKGDLIGYGHDGAGFLLKDGIETAFSAPNIYNAASVTTIPSGINGSDQIVGLEQGYATRSFAYLGFEREPDGSIMWLSFVPSAINDAGIIVGTTNNLNGYPPKFTTNQGVVEIQGVDYSYQYPGATQTSFAAINNQNEIVGFEDSTLFTGTLSIVASPEPSSMLLTVSAFLAVPMFLLVRRRSTRPPR